ncbi:hypothetical protein B4135_2367 [Caldibacillus debilis]|uniref:Uncharacterized protein n=1 Tax=Caldibacillus debilis TaxID=301148 RepID=A0A150M0N8_9BACI|nr:hypothetical protein B4135_2367 [Caldibacillus debilis]
MGCYARKGGRSITRLYDEITGEWAASPAKPDADGKSASGDSGHHRE